MTRYLVTARPTLPPAQVIDLAATLPGVVDIAPLVRIIVVDIDDADLLTVLDHPDVATVDPDQTAPLTGTVDTAAWHLDRIDQPALPLDGQFTTTHDGTGVLIYILDTGVLATHAELTGRTAPGYQTGAHPAYAPVNGHGTAVASAAAGTTVGVAPGATVVSINVAMQANGDTTTAALISALDWIIANHPDGTPGVANLSYGFTADNTSVDAATTALQDTAGVSLVVSAGNQNTTATGSPNRSPGVLCVGATTVTDRRASFSNYGPLLDLYAPGEGLLLADSTGDAAYSLRSGTSFAAPLVAGALAAMLHATPTLTPDQVGADLLALVVHGKVTGAPTGTTGLLYTGTTTAGGDPIVTAGTEYLPAYVWTGPIVGDLGGWLPVGAPASTPAAGGAVGASMSRSLSNTAAQTGLRTVVMDTNERVDAGFTTDTSTGIITVAEAGWYHLYGSARFTPAAGNGYSVAFVVDATTEDAYARGMNQVAANTTDVAVSGVAYLAAGAAVKLQVISATSAAVQGDTAKRTALRVIKL